MTGLEMQRRVDAWTDRRSTFPRDDETPAALWDACSGSFGATSPPAIGCLLALVREAWGLPHAYAAREVTGAGTNESPRFPTGAERTADGGWVRYGWRVNPGDGSRGALAGISHAAEAEALVAALEAAP